MISEKHEKHSQKRYGGGNHPSFKYNDWNPNHGAGGWNGGGRGRSYCNNRSWTSDNAGANCNTKKHKNKSKFKKFNESYKRHSGSQKMNGFLRNQIKPFNQSDRQSASQQNVTIHQFPAETAEMDKPATIKETIVKDLTETAIVSTSAVNIGKTALTELMKNANLPLRYPMHTIENQVPKIKIEKKDQNESTQQPKPQLKQKSSSSSSSSDEELICKKQQVETPKPASQEHKTLNADNKKKKSDNKAKKHKSEKLYEPATKPNPASSSSSEEKEKFSEAESSRSEEHTLPLKSTSKSVKKDKKRPKPERKLNFDEDVMCLGKLKTKFTLHDEELESNETSSKSKQSTDSCILCDKRGHTSFECQMICKNCSNSYHNLKNCPQPANISLIMQYFMEFLMKQLATYNPQATYTFDQHLRTNGTSFENALPSQLMTLGSPAVSSTYGKRKCSQKAAKTMESVTKKSTKKRRNLKSKKKDIESDTFSSPSQSESETSSEATSSNTYKRKNSKIKQEQQFVNPFPGTISMPPYSALPGFGVHHANTNVAAAASFNPMFPILNQMMQNGYPVHGAFNYSK